MTLSQADIYFEQVIQPASPLYNVGGYIRIAGLDVARLAAAHARLVASHDAFGIRLQVDQGALGQSISAERTGELPVLDFSLTPDPASAAHAWLTSLFETALRYADGELFKAYLLRIGNDEYWYVGLAHHLAMDGWGFASWASDLAAGYAGTSAEQAGAWDAVAADDAAYLAGPRSAADRSYWGERLRPLPEHLFSPVRADGTAPSSPGRSRRRGLRLSTAQRGAVESVAQACGAGIANVLLALYASYLYGATGHDRFVLGIPLHNRSGAVKKRMLGVFASISPLLVEIAPLASFADLVRQLGEQQRANLRHQRYPLGPMLRDLGLHDRAGTLYQAAFNYLRLDHDLAFDGAPAGLVYLSHQHDPTPLSLTVWEHRAEHAIELQIDYNLGYFSDADSLAIEQRLCHLLDRLPQLCDLPLARIEVLTPAEAAALRAQPARAVPGEMCLHELFEAQAARQPDAVAVRCGPSHWSYAQLNARANGLAQRLLAAGVQPDVPVGVCVERSFEMVVAVLAILKAGGAYVPLDPSYPPARLAYVLENSGARLAIVHRPLAARLPLPPEAMLDVEQPAPERARDSGRGASGLNPSSLAYVIYTSGSTGQPKGVAIEHASAVALVRWAASVYRPDELRNVLASTSLNFDLSVFELFVPLALGYSCVVVPNALALLTEPCDVSLINTVPSAMKLLLAAGAIPASTRAINLAGEPLSAELVNGILQEGTASRVFNLYGPSEDTTYSTYAEFSAPVATPPHIGRGVSDTSLYVLSAARQLLPPGALGELYIGGAGLARGYLNRPELTAERFVPDTVSGRPGQRLYRTGDLVRWRPDGNLSFEGRIDDQVKIRGFRVELGEIEAQLAALPDVREAVVVAIGEPDSRRLVAYVVAPAVPATTAERSGLATRLLSALAGQLAPYMLPSALLVLDAFPLTLNGKIDKRALPDPQASAGQVSEAPEGALETGLAALWAQLLGMAQIGATDNVFAAGANSLLLTQLIHRARSALGQHLSVRDVYEAPTVRALAQRLQARPEEGPGLQAGAGRARAGLSAAQRRIWLAERWQPEVSNNIVGAVPLPRALQPALLEAALLLLVQRHDMLRTAFGEDEQGEPWQTAHAQAQPRLDCHSLLETVANQRAAQSGALLARHAQLRFDPAVPGLFAIAAIALESELTILQGNFHHLIADGWSVVLFFDELMATYGALETARLAPPAALDYTYRDYVAWQAGFADSAEAGVQRAFWRDYLRGASATPALPFRAAAPLAAPEPARALRVLLAAPLRAALDALARQHGASLAHVLHAALALLLARLSGETELIVGMPVSGRQLAGSASMFGMFLNHLPVRSRVDLGTTFSTLLENESANLRSVLAHADLPFEDIAALAEDEHGGQGRAQFQVFLNVLSLPQTADGRNLFQAADSYLSELGSKFELTLYLADAPGGLQLQANYQSALFDGADIEHLLAQYVFLLEQVARDAQQRCSAYMLRADLGRVPESAFARAALAAVCLPDPRVALPLAWPGNLPALLADGAACHPERSALEFGATHWSYARLHQCSEANALRLRQDGVRDGDVVAIMSERSDLLVLAMLSVLKAGAAFMLLSEQGGERRLALQLETVPPRALLQLAPDAPRSTVVERVFPQTCLRLALASELPPPPMDALHYRALAPTALAYISFTSGTEGRPKAVLGHHACLTVFTPWFARRFDLDHRERVGLLSGLVHDPLLREVGIALGLGATLCIPDGPERDPVALGHWLARQELSMLNLTPSLAAWVASACEAPLHSVRTVFLVGEQLKLPHLRQLDVLVPAARVVNLYGATESGRALGYQVMDHAIRNAARAVLPVGQGADGVQLLVCDADLRPCGVGESGQIGIRSACLTLGYHNDPERTAARFVHPPGQAEAAERIYLTGDIGRYRRDGLVECLGRRDEQVKVRGYRVELAEIEVCLASHPAVREAAVAARTTAGACVIEAYACARAPGCDTAALLAHLQANLPDYMWPATVTLLDAIPLTVNGKLDTKRLPAPADMQRQLSAPASALEGELLTLWRELLGRDDIGVTEGFFRLGGNSLLATRLVMQLRRQCGVELAYSDFFTGNSIRQVAARIDSARLAASVQRRGATRRQMSL